MTNVENISYYEKLHDLFENVHPTKMPEKLAEMIEYLEKAGEYHDTDVGSETSILYALKDAFAQAIKPGNKSFCLKDEMKNYEVDIYPIMRMLKDNSSIIGELDELKARLVSLSHAKNISEMKKMYIFAESLSIIFSPLNF
jgi:hypothetical protein